MAHEIQNFIKKNRNKFYFICFIPRSGSNHLTSLMEESGFGAPAEYYYPYDFKSRYETWNAMLPYYFRKCDKLDFFRSIFDVGKDGRHSEPTGIKISWDSLNIVMYEVGWLVKELEPKYIYLTRKDKLLQAISWHKASCTEVWSSDDVGKDQSKEYNYDKNGIKDKLDLIHVQENMFLNYLSDKKPLNLFYEDGYDMDTISSFLQAPIVKSEKTILGNFEILRNDENYEYKNRFLTENT